jgi:hypothetical protein
VGLFCFRSLLLLTSGLRIEGSKARGHTLGGGGRALCSSRSAIDYSEGWAETGADRYHFRGISQKKITRTLARLGVGKNIRADIIQFEKRTGRDASECNPFGGVCFIGKSADRTNGSCLGSSGAKVGATVPGNFIRVRMTGANNLEGRPRRLEPCTGSRRQRLNRGNSPACRIRSGG